jgi:hypothetical protein
MRLAANQIPAACVVAKINCREASVCRKVGSVNSALIIAAWMADVWVKPVKFHGCASPPNPSRAG